MVQVRCRGGAPSPSPSALPRPPPPSVYEDLGHAETVQVELRGGEGEQAAQFRRFAEIYFQQASGLVVVQGARRSWSFWK